MAELMQSVSGSQQITAGPITAGNVIPPPVEIVCIQVEKIFDSCSNVECAEYCVNFTATGVVITPTLPTPVPPFTFVSCTAGPGAVSGPITELPVPGQPLLQRVIADICGPASVVFTDSLSNTFTISIPSSYLCFHKDVLLYMPDPDAMFGKIEVVTFTCLGARFITTGVVPQVCVTIGLRAIVKSAAWVQLLIPAYGYCPVPPTCRELGTLCEGFEAEPFPTVYPPQISGDPPSSVL